MKYSLFHEIVSLVYTNLMNTILEYMDSGGKIFKETRGILR